MQKLILLAGPSGAGKTTISEYLTKKFGIPRVITHTTRPMRAGETANESYNFEDDASFAELHFFEHVKYGPYQYGSSREALEKAWAQNDLVSLIVDINGVQSYLKELGRQVFLIYVTTSSVKLLKRRLLARGDEPKTISERLQGDELNSLPANLQKRAHILINDDWKKTEKELVKLLKKI